MKLFKDIEITVYNGVRDTSGHRSTLLEFLTDVDIDRIKRLRATKDADERKRIKLSLPQATISGVFSPTRSADNLVSHSGLICVDIDGKDNQHIENFDTLIEDVLSKIDEVVYASRSVSGNGYFVIMPLKYPAKHKMQFEQLVRDFAEMGMNIDRACGDVCRLRCQSYDLHQHINMSAKPYAGVYHPPMPKIRYPTTIAEADAEDKVAQLCREIAARGIDLTSTYDDWMKIGAALSSLGESGRQWFHIVSSQNGGYNAAECDRKFNNLLRSTRSIGIGTFFYACKQAGLDMPNY